MMVVSIAFYGMSTFEGPMMSIKAVNSLSHYTDWTIGHVHSGALGWVAYISFGAIYCLVPWLWNKREVYSLKLVNWHFWISTIGIVIYISSMWVAGILQGLMWRSINADGTLTYTFVESVKATYPFYVIRLAGGALYLAGMVLMAWKVFYVSYTLVWPIMVLDVPVWHILLGYLLLHLIAGTVLSVVFQLAHVVETSEYPQVNAAGNIETEWAIHQLKTTADFAGNNPLFTFYVGGLNYQAIHHLFPRICHVHYPKIAPIVEQTAKEFGVPYVNFPTFGTAFRSHVRMLKKLGRSDYRHLLETKG